MDVQLGFISIGAMLFLVSIAPLGVGSGFPSTLIMAAAALAILRQPDATRRWLPGALRRPQPEPAPTPPVD